MQYEEAKALLDAKGQGHVLRFWDTLGAAERSSLLAQIETLDFDSIADMQAMLTASGHAAHHADMQPAPVLTLSDDERARLTPVGEQAIRDGRVGVILVAGGQGSRLGFDGPKGCYSLAPVSGASLFEIHSRKILAFERKYRARIPFYIMTSQANDAPTRAFFAENEYFGLNPERVLFFTQGMWPALTREGKIVLDRRDHVFMSPDGHGGILWALKHRGMLDDMAARGVSSLFYFQVDNPLIEIADPVFVGAHVDRQAEMSVKVCAKRDPDEGLGVVVERDGRFAVVEYTELTPEQKRETTSDGRLRFLYGSVAIHMFSREFLEQEVRAGLPLHLAHKKVPMCDDQGVAVTPPEPNAFKFEKFIFDVLPDARSALNVAFDRADEFSPVKNAQGADSPAMAQRDMIRKFARWFEACGIRVPRDHEGEPRWALEIDPCFAVTPADLAVALPEGLRIDGALLLRDE